MIANYLYRFSTPAAVLELMSSRRRRRVPGLSVDLGIAAGLPQRSPARSLRTEEQQPRKSAAALQAEIDALEDPERWDGLA